MLVFFESFHFFINLIQWIYTCLKKEYKNFPLAYKSFFMQQNHTNDDQFEKMTLPFPEQQLIGKNDDTSVDDVVLLNSKENYGLNNLENTQVTIPTVYYKMMKKTMHGKKWLWLSSCVILRNTQIRNKNTSLITFNYWSSTNLLKIIVCCPAPGKNSCILMAMIGTQLQEKFQYQENYHLLSKWMTENMSISG